MASTDPLLNPFTLKGLTLKNRVVSTPHAPAYADDGMPGERYQRYHEEKARGGIGMTMFGGSSCVGPDSPSVFGQLDVSHDRVIPFFQRFSERISAFDCGLICQISHLGRRTTWNAADWLPVMAPSRVREPAHRGFPKEMDQADINRAIGYFADAAWRCKEGGLDGVEVLIHGHLPGQFLAPDTNQRTDGYGGSFANRFRFVRELLQAVRLRVGDDFIVGARMVSTEDFAGGQTLEEGIASAQLVEQEQLADYLTINYGFIGSDHGLAHHMPGMSHGLAPWLHHVAALRKETRLPLIHSCRLNDLSTARYAVQEGILDLVGMTRAHMADPHIVNKLRAGREEEIRPCVGAAYCIDRIYGEGEALCLHNAATGREATMPHVIARSPDAGRKIVVIGGGPAGLEAARVSAERGHKVVLFEATSQLGGQLALACKATWRRDLSSLIDYYARRLEALGVDVRWNTFAESAHIEAEMPDIVIIATGGTPDVTDVPGHEHALSVWDVLSGQPLSGSVLVYDDNGQHQAPSCADVLAEAGATVEIVTPDRSVAAEMGGVNFSIYLQRFYQKGVAMTPNHRLSGIEPVGNRLEVTFSNEFGGPDIARVVDHVVIEHGTLPADELFHELRTASANGGELDLDAYTSGLPQPLADANGYQLYRIGDAVASRNVHAAVYDALRLCAPL